MLPRLRREWIASTNNNMPLSPPLPFVYIVRVPIYFNPQTTMWARETVRIRKFVRLNVNAAMWAIVSHVGLGGIGIQ